MQRLDSSTTAKSTELEQYLSHTDVSNIIPSSIPRSGWAYFLKATPEVQRQMVKDSRQPDLVTEATRPLLASQHNARLSDNSVCYCPEIGRCPLAPAENLRHQYPSFAGGVYQYFPRDEGWWQMRHVTNGLAEHVRENGLLPKVKIIEENYRTSLDKEQ